MEKVVGKVITNQRQHDFLLLPLKELPKAVGFYWGPSHTEIDNSVLADYHNALLGKKPVGQEVKDMTSAIDTILASV